MYKLLIHKLLKNHPFTLYSTGFHSWKMFVKIHSLQKLKIRLYTKLVSNLIDFSLFLNSLPFQVT